MANAGLRRYTVTWRPLAPMEKPEAQRSDGSWTPGGSAPPTRTQGKTDTSRQARPRSWRAAPQAGGGVKDSFWELSQFRSYRDWRSFARRIRRRKRRLLGRGSLSEWLG